MKIEHVMILAVVAVAGYFLYKHMKAATATAAASNPFTS